jgi:hypothetical protein
MRRFANAKGLEAGDTKFSNQGSTWYEDIDRIVELSTLGLASAFLE